MIIHSQHYISPELSNRIILSDESKKLSQLEQLRTLLASDFFTVEKHYPKEVQFEILREELSGQIQSFIILLEDGYEDGNAESYQYLINEMKLALENVQYRNSYKISYSDFSKQIVNSLSNDYSFSSMAYKDKWDYARSWHIHDYSYANVKPAFNSGSAIAEFMIADSKNTRTLSLCLPEVVQPEYKLADVGEYRFLARANYQQIAINDPNFDGWVYADGQTYLCADFPEAYEVFNPTHDTPSYNSFSVPLISSFVKLNAFQESNMNSFTEIPFQNAIHEHTHNDIDSKQFLSLSAVSVDVNLPVYYGGTYTSQQGLHTGFKTLTNQLCEMSVVINSNKLESIPTSTNNMSELDIESVPQHIEIPLMVYIGKKVKQ